MKLENKIINFLGDSITEGWALSSYDDVFLEVIKRQHKLKEANCYGIGGTRIAKQTAPTVDNPRYDEYFLSRVESMNADADIIVVFGGTNDFGHGDAKIGCFEDRTSETFYGACHELYTALINKYPGKPIVIMTPLHRKDEDFVKTIDGRKLNLKSYVEIIREVAEYYSLPVCDMFAMSGLQPCIPIIKEKLVPDGLHPNAEGHRMIAERLANFLLAL